MVSKENLETGKNPLMCRCMTLPDLVPNYTPSGASVLVSKALAMDEPVFLQRTLQYASHALLKADQESHNKASYNAHCSREIRTFK